MFATRAGDVAYGLVDRNTRGPRESDSLRGPIYDG